MGGVLAVFVAPERVIVFAGASDGTPTWLALLKGAWLALASGYVSKTGYPAIDMLVTPAALAFGGVVEKSGVLDRLMLCSRRTSSQPTGTWRSSCRPAVSRSHFQSAGLRPWCCHERSALWNANVATLSYLPCGVQFREPAVDDRPCVRRGAHVHGAATQ